MKVKLLRKLRKKVPVYFSSEREVVDSDSGEKIDGRYVVKHPLKNANYYCINKKEAMDRRSEVILELLLDYRIRNNWILKEVKI